jgi:hypothetical protein
MVGSIDSAETAVRTLCVVGKGGFGSREAKVDPTAMERRTRVKASTMTFDARSLLKPHRTYSQAPSIQIAMTRERRSFAYASKYIKQSGSHNVT